MRFGDLAETPFHLARFRSVAMPRAQPEGSEHGKYFENSALGAATGRSEHRSRQ